MKRFQTGRQTNTGQKGVQESSLDPSVQPYSQYLSFHHFYYVLVFRFYTHHLPSACGLLSRSYTPYILLDKAVF